MHTVQLYMHTVQLYMYVVHVFGTIACSSDTGLQRLYVQVHQYNVSVLCHVNNVPVLVIEFLIWR